MITLAVIMSAAQRVIDAPTGVASALQRLSDSAERHAHGTAAGLRRTIAQLPESSSAHLAERYAALYRTALNESLLLFFHISKSGGTALCELSKLNGCWRAAAGESTLNTNCVDRVRFDGPWWLPHTSIKAIEDPGLRHFADTNFKMPMRSPPNRRCGWLGSRRLGERLSDGGSCPSPTGCVSARCARPST